MSSGSNPVSFKVSFAVSRLGESKVPLTVLPNSSLAVYENRAMFAGKVV